MQNRNIQRDASSLIMRNPYESLSGSKQSSKFYEPKHSHIQVRQFEGNHQTQRQKNCNHRQNQQNNKEMKYVYSFYDQSFKGQDFNTEEKSIKNHSEQADHNLIPKQINAEFNYPQRLTFENQSVSPFIRIQNPTKNTLPNDQIEPRHSFNPLQNKVNELQKMCKKLYEMSLEQINKAQIERSSILRIERKIDYLLEFYQNLEQRKLTKLMTRGSHDNKKRSSIPHKSIESKNNKDIQLLNSSEKLSRYLEPPSSSEANFKRFDERSIYNNSKGTQSSKARQIKPFLANSEMQNESSIPELYHNLTIQFSEDETNKENVDSFNFNCPNTKEYNPMRKKNQSQKYHTAERVKDSSEKVIKQRKSSEKIHQKSTKVHKTKVEELRKLPNTSKQAQNCKHNQKDQKFQRQRAKSQNTTNRKRVEDPNRKNKTYYEVSVTAPNADYEQRQRSQTYNNSRVYERGILQTSAIFKAVEFPANYCNNEPMQMKQSLSSELQRHKKKELIQNHNKTLLQSIEEKKQLIDRQLSKRLMKNAALLHGGSTNMLISKEKYS